MLSTSIEKFKPEEVIRLYVYVPSEKDLWTVGFYDPRGKFIPESDHNSAEEAAKRVHWLNGGTENQKEVQDE